jgi:GTP pyrophosphokinase
MQLLKKAFNMALDACTRQHKKLGDITIVHALGVARIVAEEIGLGINSVVSALLFDFVSDGTISISKLKNEFSPKIIFILEGLCKITGIDTQKSTDHGENLRSLLITLITDIRVILVKIADRLYYMRNLEQVDQSEQIRISSEVLYIYAPLAHRVGLYNIKSEMEDLTLK